MRAVHAGKGERGESPLRGCYARESAGDETCPCGGGRARGEGLVNGLCHGLTDGNGLSGVGRGESAGSETCPMRGREIGRAHV